MQRRSFLTLLGGAAAAWPLAARAQQPTRMRRIGALIDTIENDSVAKTVLAALLEGLEKLGWTEGRNLQLDVHWGAGDRELLTDHATKLARQAPEVLVADGGAATRALQRVTQTIPIVYLQGGDPEVTGMVRNIARPEGNITGFSGVTPSFAGKWLELLKEAAPHVTHVAVLYNPQSLSTGMRSGYISTIAGARAMVAAEVIEIPVRDPFDIVRSLDAFAMEPNGGLIVLPTTTAGGNRDTLFRVTEQHRLPAIYSGSRDQVVAGALMAYGSNAADQSRRAATYVDRLLRGAKVSDLPVQFPTKYELVVNLKTAKAIGLTIPEAFLLRADEIIE